MKFAFYDHKKKEWETDWSTLDASGTPYLPAHVRITLTVIDERGKEVSYSTDARIQITENVSYRPAPDDEDGAGDDTTLGATLSRASAASRCWSC